MRFIERREKRMQNIRQYIREGRFAFRAGRSFLDGIRLLGITGLFHLGNAVGASGSSKPRRHRVRLLDRRHDLWMRTISGDIFVFYEIFLSHCYHVPSLDLSQASLIVDLGANIGITTLYFAARAPQAHFVCVEPVPENAALLRRNLASILDATVVEAAVGKTGSTSFDDRGPSWGGSLSPDGRITVDAIAMDEVMRLHARDSRVDLLKMDIEGGERDVFAGEAAWLDRVDAIVAELHPPFTIEQFRSVLTNRGFVVYEGGERGCAMPTAIRPGARCGIPGTAPPQH